jgi:Zn-dependent protease
MKFSEREITDLVKAWVAISIAFGIIIAKSQGVSLFSQEFTKFLLVSAFTVGVAFLLHELGHKFVAQRYHFWAEFRSWNSMLIFAIILAIISPIIFVAPGAVMIHGYYMTREKNGIISAAGPLVNLALALLFVVLILSGVKNMFTSYGLLINSWIALFNLIPFANIDGKKILTWNRTIYFLMAAFGIVFLILSSAL